MNTTKGFLFFYDWEKSFAALDGDEFKGLFLAMVKYQRDGTEPPEFDGIAGIIANFVFPQLERRAASSKGGKSGMANRYKKESKNTESDSFDNEIDEPFDKSLSKSLNKSLNESHSKSLHNPTLTQDKDKDKDKVQDKVKDKDKDEVQVKVKVKDQDEVQDQVKVKDEVEVKDQVQVQVQVKDEVQNQVEVRDFTPLSPQGDETDLEEEDFDLPFFPDQTFEQIPEVQESEKDTVEERFNIFWEKYPKKVAREHARKAYLRLKPDDSLFEIMLEALKAQKQCSQWKDAKYIPNPATWINGRRWEDETYVYKGNSSSTENELCLEDYFENF